MNSLSGIISHIEVDGKLSLVKVQVGHLELSVIVIDTPQTVDYLKIGRQIHVIFKETEVIVGKTTGVELSLQNKISGVITHMSVEKLLTKLILSTPYGEISSIITSNAIAQLGIKVGDKVLAMIKTNEMMLSE